jgi:hypothetical protein
MRALGAIAKLVAGRNEKIIRSAFFSLQLALP